MPPPSHEKACVQCSTLAVAVIDDAARELAHSVANVVARGAVSADVVCAGGVITNQPRLYDAFARHVGALGHDLTVHMLKVPPVAGALALARSIGGTHHLPMHHESRRIS